MAFKTSYLCIPAISSSGVGRVKNLMKLSKDYSNHDSVKKRLSPGQVKSSFIRYFKQATGKNISTDKHIPSVEELKRIYKYANRGMKSLDRGELTKFERSMWLTEEMVKRSPELSSWYKTESRIQGNFRGNSIQFNNSLHQVAAQLRKQAGESGLGASLKGNVTRSRAEKKIQSMENEIRAAHKAEDWATRDAVMQELDTYYKEGEGVGFKQFYDLVTNNKYKAGNAPPLIQAAARVWRNEMQPKLDKSIMNGLDSFYWGFKNMQGKLNSQHFASALKKIELIRHKVRQYINDPKSKHNFPIRMLDIVPTLGKVNELFSARGVDGARQQGDKLLSDLVKNVVEMDFSVANTLFKTSEGSVRESMNVLPMLDAYTRSVARFEMVGATTKNMLQSIQKITEKKGNDELVAKELDSFVDFIKDSYVDIAGGKETDAAHEMVRTLTNLQAVFKLGLPNFKSPAKNLTQSFQHFTWFGYQGMKETRVAMGDPKMRMRVTEHLRDNAILFQNLGETWGGPKADKIYDEATGLWHEKIDISLGEQMQRALEKTTEKGLWGMTKVENSWNRRGSTEHAYVQKWNADNMDSSLSNQYRGYILNRAKYNKIEELRGEDGKSTVPFRKSKQEYNEWAADVIQTLTNQKTHDLWTGEGKVSDFEYYYELWRRDRAGDHADSITKEIHFDYSRLAKPGIMKDTKAGVLVGQFRTWWVNNMNYQRKLFLEGKDDVASGMYGGEHAWRMYRMGLQHVLGLAVLSPLLNVNLGAIIDNNSWWDSITMGWNVANAAGQHITEGDVEPETRDAILAGTYSNGIIPHILGVHAGDSLKFGSLVGFQRFNQEDTLSYMLGYDTWADLTQDDKVKEFALGLHTGLGRLTSKHLPNVLTGGSPGQMLDDEMGWKPTALQKGIREGVKQKLGISDKEIRQTLTKPSTQLGTSYPMTESEILDMMLANIAPAGGGAKGSPSAASFEAQLKRIA
jgi:hypothetical protein